MILLSLLLFLFMFLISLYWFSKQRPPNFPPGPPRLPIWGSYWLVIWNNFTFTHKAYHMLAKKYRTKILGLYLGDFPTVVVSDYENVRQVLTRPEFQGRIRLFILDERTYKKNLGIIFTDEDFWIQQRRFSLRHMRDFGFGRRFQQFENIIQEEIQDMMSLLHGKRDDKEIFSNGLVLVPELFYYMIFNPIWYILTGARFSTKEEEKLKYFMRNALCLQRSIDSTGNAIAFVPWIRHFIPSYSGFKDFIGSTTNILGCIEQAFSEHLKTYSEDHVRDFIDQYIMEIKKQLEKGNFQTTFTDEQLCAVVLDYLFPGSTTVTSTLNFAMAFLVNYPEIQLKMQDELDRVVGRNRPPTLNDRAKLPYNEAFLREVMRKETLAPLSVIRRCTEDTELGGYNIPKGTAMIVNLWSFHLDPDFWGDPNTFRPERFLEDDGQHLKKDYSLPFGAGKRLCAGETYARQIMFLILSNLLQNFSVKCSPDKTLPSTSADLPGIIVSKRSMWIKFELRN